MTIEFEQTQEDYIDFYFYYHWSTPEKYWYRIKVRIVVIIVICFMPYFMGYKIENYGGFEYSIVAYGIICTIFLGHLVKFISRLQIKNIIKSGKNINMTGHRIIQFENDKIIIKTPTALSEVNWSAMEKLGETTDHLFLFTSVNQSIPIPKRIFKTDDEKNEVRNFIYERIKNN